MEFLTDLLIKDVEKLSSEITVSQYETILSSFDERYSTFIDTLKYYIPKINHQETKKNLQIVLTYHEVWWKTKKEQETLGINISKDLFRTQLKNVLVVLDFLKTIDICERNIKKLQSDGCSQPKKLIDVFNGVSGDCKIRVLVLHSEEKIDENPRVYIKTPNERGEYIIIILKREDQLSVKEMRTIIEQSIECIKNRK
uniref:Uncharacterized protein n=1 Tax=viral metagenome TaxID=1070528 RepID=A0A6C0JSL7_9ZZZZ